METHPKRSTVYIPVNIQGIHIWGAQGQKGALKESSCLQGLGKTEVQNKTIHFESSHTADAPLQKRPKKPSPTAKANRCGFSLAHIRHISATPPWLEALSGSCCGARRIPPEAGFGYSHSQVFLSTPVESHMLLSFLSGPKLHHRCVL